MDENQKRDIFNRSIKTFVQSFLGVLIPEFAMIMKDMVNMSLEEIETYLLPVVAAAVSAGICAVWNYVYKALSNAWGIDCDGNDITVCYGSEYMDSDDERDEDLDEVDDYD